MTLKRTQLEEREDRRLKSTLYDSAASRKAREERNQKPTAVDGVRRRHADERGEINSRQHDESARLRHRHGAAVDKHYAGSTAKPLQMLEKHKEEDRQLKERHATERTQLNGRHREEIDRAEG
jgi:hypothetical protein